MGGPLARNWFDTLIDDDGSGTKGTVWNKTQVGNLFTTIDASLAPLVVSPVPGDLPFSADIPILRRTTADGADTGAIWINGGGGNGQARGSEIVLIGNERPAYGGGLWLNIGATGADPSLTVRRSDGQVGLRVRGNDGGVEFPYGRLQFPAAQNPSSDLNTLDDYREHNNWQFSIGATGGASGVSYGTTTGTYCKIGRRVFFDGTIILANKGTMSGQLAITNLPFLPTVSYSGGVAFGYVLGGPAGGISGLYSSSGSILLYRLSDMGALAPTDITNTLDIRFSGHYFATN